MSDHLHPLAHGITAIDTGFVRRRFDAAYLVVSRGRAAFIDVGINSAVPRLLDALSAAGLGTAAVDWVIVTHVHLDHAGAAGALMALLPQARLLVHPRGARHIADPRALVAGAAEVYGDEAVRQTYGEIVPVQFDRIVASHDGLTVAIGDRALQCIDTPGHARHHHCVWDAQSRGWFTGDTFGLSYPEFATPKGPCVFPTTTPVQFDPEALKASIARLLERDPERMYITHFGPIEQPASAAAQLVGLIDRMVELALSLRTADNRHARLLSALTTLYQDHALRVGSLLANDEIAKLLSTDTELNAQGLAVWLDSVSH